jgi:signal transduction histidine kinase
MLYAQAEGWVAMADHLATWREHIALRSRAAPLSAVRPQFSLPLAVCLCLLGLVVLKPLPGNPTAPPGALIVLITMVAATILVMRYLRMRFGLTVRAALALPDPLYMLYLAAAILVGSRPAIVLAMLASFLMTLPDVPLPDGKLTAHDWSTSLRQACAAGATTLIAGVTYRWISLLLVGHLRAIHAHLISAFLAAFVMLLGVAAMRALEEQPTLLATPYSWRASLAHPGIRFQALMLAIAPLLPLSDMLDNVEAEVAWVIFLVPLYAMYYLALVSTRLEQRKSELQRTVEELRISRLREAELTDYAALITHAQEEERRRLARELHDDTAQALVALARGLDTLSSEASGRARPARDARFVEDLSELAKRSLESIRRACQDLRPSVLDDLGLAPALESLAGAMTQRGLPTEFTQLGEPRTCRPEVEMTTYRIAQEALSNARRHAHATQAKLELTYAPGKLCLLVRDDGLGFEYASVLSHVHRLAAEPEVRSGLGLLGMRERAALIGASLEIESAPGCGTCVTLVMPIEAHE